MGYFRTDTEHDAVSSLEAAVRFFSLVPTNEHYYKWAVLAVHSATQGLLVLALRQGNWLLVQKKSTAKRMLDAFEGLGEFPEPYMDNFWNLYCKAQDPSNFVNSAVALDVDFSRDATVRRFDQMRHYFVHFNTGHWSIATDVIHDGATAAISAMRSLMGSGALRWYSQELQHDAAVYLDQLADAV